MLAILFFFALVVFLAQFILREKMTLSQQPEAPINDPEINFVVEVPQKALFKNYVVVSAQTSPATSCELMYVPPSGEVQEMQTIADNNGRCVWRWKIDEADGKGNGRLIFTIGGKSETHFFEIRSSF